MNYGTEPLAGRVASRGNATLIAIFSSLFRLLSDNIRLDSNEK